MFRLNQTGRFYLVNIILNIASMLLVHNTFSQKVASFQFDDVSGVTSTQEQISLATFQVSNHFNKPERIQGISGNALRLDGYSTWAYNTSFQIPGVHDKMTISAWFAPEAFNKETGAIISQIDANSGFALEIDPFGSVGFTFFADSQKFNIVSSRKLLPYKWNLINAMVDLDNSIVRILVNGEEWAYDVLNNSNQITFSNTTLFIGRHNLDIRNAGFLLTSLNGAIDDVNIYNEIQSDSSVLATYLQSSAILPDLTIDPFLRYSGDHLRPHYHAMPDACWTNECYGLIFYNDEYHLFFQKNPNSPTLYYMHWGHLSSTDLVNWKEEKIALSPSSGFDNYGIWSGSAINDESGKPTIFYTGVNGVKAGIGRAYSTDNQLEYWVKDTANPLIPSPPSGYQTMDFRDPFVWKDSTSYYMIIGSGIQNSGGGILFTYKSSDLRNWTPISPLYRNVYVSETGYFWEMPFFFPLNNKEYILGVNPIPYNGIPAQTLYWIGKWENEKFTPYFSSAKKLELINNLLLAPSFSKDTSGRVIYMGIIPEDRDGTSQIQAEWRHLFSLPRVVRYLADSTIGQIPHPNLCRLRDSLTIVTNRIIEPGTNHNLPEIQGVQQELSLAIKAESGTRFSIQVYLNEMATEFTSINFDLSLNKISFDRSHSSLSPGTPTDYRSSDYVFNWKDTIYVQIFLDHSTIEVFVDKITVFSFRVYPSSPGSNKVDFVVTKGKAEILNLQSWKLKDMRDVNSMEICELQNLPNKYRKPGESYGTNEISENIHKLYVFPNPAKDLIYFSFPSLLKDSAELKITDITGKIVLSEQLSLGSTELRRELNVSSLIPGQYMVTILVNSQKYCGAFIVL